jgi:ElaB/YqjD/DUF883 family membrane-anchored ribosome-binding protein
MVQKQTHKAGREGQPESPRELVENLREMIDEAEKMIVHTATHQMDETVEELRERLEEKIDQMKATYQQAEDRVVNTAVAADKAIREKPYQSLGIAAAVGIAIGVLLNRKR